MNRDIYYEYFKNNILPVIQPLEKKRIQTVYKVILFSLLFFGVGIFFAGLFIYNAINNLFSQLLFPILLFFMYAFIIKSIINVIIAGREYKKQLVEKVLPLFFEPVAKFRYWQEKDVEAVINSQLFGSFDELEENLCIYGFYNNTGIRISDTSLLLPVKSSEKSYLFKGTMIKFELPKSFQNHLIFLSKNLKMVNKYSQINPHIENLNKFLYCFAKNSTNTEFISEDLWQVIKRFGKAYSAKSFAMSIKNDTVLIALKQKKPMQFGFLFKSLTNIKNYDELIERFVVIFDLIDVLNN